MSVNVYKVSLCCFLNINIDGYYMTKQPNPEELDSKISYESARRNEETFFKTKKPWCDHPNLRKRMGTPQLTEALSKLLGTVIKQA